MRENNGYAFTEDEITKRVKGIIKKTTNNLGRTEFKGDQIICHIDNKKLNKYLEVNGNTLDLTGFTIAVKFFLQQKYGIDKPIKYIINHYRFNDVLLDTLGDTILQFNNCIFEGYDLNVGYINNIIFYNSKFHLDNGLNLFNNKKKQIENVKLIDCNFWHGCSIAGADNIYIVSDKLYISGGRICSSKDINIKSNNVKIVNSALYSGISLHDGYTNIYSNNFKLFNSSLEGDILRLVSPSMQVVNSSFDYITADVYNQNCDIGELNFKSEVKYNDVTILPCKEYFITRESYELLKERQRLANTLYKVNEKCEEEINKKIRVLKCKSVSDTLNN